MCHYIWNIIPLILWALDAAAVDVMLFFLYSFLFQWCGFGLFAKHLFWLSFFIELCAESIEEGVKRKQSFLFWNFFSFFSILYAKIYSYWMSKPVMVCLIRWQILLRLIEPRLNAPLSTIFFGFFFLSVFRCWWERFQLSQFDTIWCMFQSRSIDSVIVNHDVKRFYRLFFRFFNVISASSNLNFRMFFFRTGSPFDKRKLYANSFWPNKVVCGHDNKRFVFIFEERKSATHRDIFPVQWNQLPLYRVKFVWKNEIFQFYGIDYTHSIA